MKHFYFDGTAWKETGNFGEDPAPGSGGVNTRAGFYLATFSVFADAGYIGGLDNDIALTLEFESNLADRDLHICLDTCNQITAWEWSNGDEDFPIWDNGLGVNGPRCWEIIASPNSPPDWCYEVSDYLSFRYCQSGIYQLCALSYQCSAPPLYYHLVAPYDDGNYGSVDPSSGLWIWSGPTVQPGFYDIEFQVDGGAASSNFHLYIEVTDCNCCVGRVGDVNILGGDEPTIGDVSTIIDALFISGEPELIACPAEADVNQSGGPYPHAADITIGDISILIDYLFITGPGLGLPDCM
jgi:hypothetical protein